MKIEIATNPRALGQAAGQSGAELIRQAIALRGIANIILATGTSQFETLKQLIAAPGIDWGQVSMFHLDEYLGLPITHPASFRKYLKERFLLHVPALKAVYFIDGEADPGLECDRLSRHISDLPIDVAFVGIGENGHLAFNDPPADFETERPYIVVELDGVCRKQQLGEGWFNRIEEVPHKAISMSVRQIMKSKNIICSVPGSRKAVAVKDCIEKTISNLFPATALQSHINCIYFLDKDSASLLNGLNEQ